MRQVYDTPSVGGEVWRGLADLWSALMYELTDWWGDGIDQDYRTMSWLDLWSWSCVSSVNIILG